jgi:solute carrier family 35 protein C2
VLQTEFGTFLAPLFLAFPGCIAFCMTASEFALLQRTSVVTLSIAGIFKEVVTISAASVVFEDRLTFVNLLGLIITLVAIVAYNWFKISKMREQAQADVVRHDHSAGNGSGSSSSSDIEGDEGGEEMGLLARHSAEMEMPTVVVTSDGEVVSTSPVYAAEEEHEHRS